MFASARMRALAFACVCAALVPARMVRAEGVRGAPESEAEVRTPLSASLQQAGFGLITDKRGVKVYRHERDPLVHIAGEGRLPAPPDRVRALLLDYDRHAGNIPRLVHSRVVSRADGALLVHQRLALPVVDDRDFVLRVRWAAEGADIVVTYRAVTDEGPPPADGVVRVRLHSGSWQLRPIQEGRATFARYQTRIDLSGWMPKWLARSRAGADVPGLFRALRRMLTRGPSR